MLRRVEFWLMVAVAAAMFGAAIIGRRVAPSASLLDERRSAMLSGPLGAKALAELLDRLGLAVELCHRPLFDWGSDRPDRGREYLALLDIDIPLTDAELRTLRNAVARGHGLLLAGANDVERCFAYRTTKLGRFESDSSVAVVISQGIDTLPAVSAILERVATDSLSEVVKSLGCDILFPTKTDTLLATVDGQVVAVRLSFSQGGTAILIADSRLVTNRALRETDAGLMVVPWVMQLEPKRLEIDEYHHGFQGRTSIFTAAWHWMYRSPLGWVILQLSGVALLALALSAIRFGPARTAVTRERRSALEHVDALAVGLQRAQSGNTAVTLIASGLRRRLGRAGSVQGGHQTLVDWLAKLGRAVHNTEARRKLERLTSLVREPGGDQYILEAATSVEDVWTAMGQHNEPGRSSKP